MSGIDFDPTYGLNNLDKIKQEVEQSYGDSSFNQIISRKLLSMESGIPDEGYLGRTSRGTPDMALWQSALYYAAIPEEWSAKLIGKLYSNDSKYDFSSGSNYYNQVGFYENFRDAHFSPVTAALLGFAAAMVNPGDPWGKLRILRATKSGILGQEVVKAQKVGLLTKGKVGFTKGLRTGQVSEDIIKPASKGGLYGKEVDVFDIKNLDVEISKLQKAIAGGGDNIGNLKKSLKGRLRQKKKYIELNDVLLHLQSKGAKIDEIKWAESIYERITKGQLHILGWSSPLKLDQLSLFGIHRGQMNAASRINLGSIGLIPIKAQAKFATMMGDLKGGFKSRGLALAQRASEFIGQDVVKGKRVIDAQEALKIIFSEFGGNAQELQDAVINWANRIADKISVEEMKDIVNKLESMPVEVRLSVKADIDEFVKLRKTDPKKLNQIVAKSVKNVSEEEDLAAQGITVGSRMTDRQVALQTPSGLSPKESAEAVEGIPGAGRVSASTKPLRFRSRDLPLTKEEMAARLEAKAQGKEIPEARTEPVRPSDFGPDDTRELDEMIEGLEADLNTAERAIADFEDAGFDNTSFQLVHQQKSAVVILEDLAILKNHRADLKEAGPTITGKRVSAKYVVRQGGKSDPDSLKGVKDVQGVSVFRNEGDLIVARRLTGAAPIQLDRLGKATNFNESHLDHLIGLIKDLALKGRVLTRLHPEDFLIQPHGGIQLVNPDIIRMVSGKGAKAQKEALKSGWDSIIGFINKYTHLADNPSSYESLTSLSKAKKAPKRYGFRSNKHLKPGDESQSVHDVIEQSPNMKHYRDLFDRVEISEAEMIQIMNRVDGGTTIQRELTEIIRQLEITKNPMIKAVILQIDPNTGMLDVVEGRARLAAAKMAGMDWIPVKIREFENASGNFLDGYYIGNSHRLKEFFNLDGKPKGVVRERQRQVGRPKEPVQDPIISENYRIEDWKGQLEAGKVRELDAQSMQTPGIHAVRLIFQEILGVGVSDATKAVRAKTAPTYMLKNNIPTHELAVAELAESSENFQEFLEAVKKLLQDDKGRMGGKPGMVNITKNMREAEEIFNLRLKPASKQYLDELATEGYLSDRSLGILDRVQLATADGKTLVTINEAKNIITYANSTQDMNAMRRYAEADMYRFSDASDVDPSIGVLLHGSDGDELIRVRDLIRGDHPRLRDAYADVPRGIIDVGRKAEWKAKGIIEATEEDLKAMGTTHGIFLGRSKKMPDGTTQWTHNKIPMVIMRDGTIYISQKHDHVGKMLNDMFQEGSRYHAETGIIDGGRIIINDIEGSLIASVGNSDLRVIEGRIRQIADNLIKIGLAPQNELVLKMPFDASIWRKMYGLHTSLGDITKKRFKLKISKEMRGAVINTDIRHENRVFSIHNKKFDHQNPLVREIFQFLRNTLDEAFQKEGLAALNGTYLISYFPRITTVEGRLALAAVNDLAAAHLSKSDNLKTTEAFMRERLFTELTTHEINDFFKMIATVRKDLAKTPEKWISEVVEKARTEFQANVSKGGRRAEDFEITDRLAKRYLAISEHLGEENIFQIMPLMAVHERALAGLRARKGVKVFDALVEAGVAKIMTVDGIEGAVKVQKNIDKAKVLLGKESENLARVEGELETFTKLDVSDPNMLSSLEARIKIARQKKATALGVVDGLEAKKLEAQGSAAWDIDFNNQRIFIEESVAKKMIQDGVLDDADLPHGYEGSTMVAIDNFKKYRVLFDKRGTQIMVMNKEAAALARRFFNITTKDMHKVAKMWDYVHDIWRTITLFPIPAYHIRNVISSFNMAWLGGVDTAESYAGSWRITGILSQKRAGKLTLEQANEALQSMKFSMGNRVVDGQEMLEEFHRRGGVLGGFYYNEFSRFGNVKRRSDFERIMNNKFKVNSVTTATDSFILDNAGIRAGYKAGQFIETKFRLAAFIHHSNVGGSFDEGEKMMKAIFYDYSNLSVTERDVLRRVIPFYSWARQNTPRMLETLLMDPVKHVRLARMVRSIEQGALDREPPDEEGIAGYVRDNFGTIIHKAKDGTYYMKDMVGLFPAYDIFRMMRSPTSAVTDTFGVTPFLKFPLEQFNNYSAFLGRKIEEVEGQPSNRPHSLGALGATKRSQIGFAGPLGPLNLIMSDSFIQDFFRLGSEAANFIDNLYDPKNFIDGSYRWKMAFGELLLGRGRNVVPERTRAAMTYKNNFRASRLLKLIKLEEEAGNKIQADNMKRLYMDHVLKYGGTKGK